MTKKRRSSVRAPGGSTASRVLVLLEKIEQQNRATIDAVYAESRRITDMFEARFVKIELRLDALEIAVRKNSEDIRKNSEDIRKNSEDIVKLQQEVKRLAKILGADEKENAIQALDRRVRVLEERLGVVPPAA